MLGKVFKAYDIRGVYGDLLTDTMAWQIGYGTAKYLLLDAENDGETSPMMRNIVVGRDMRLSSPALVERLNAGMNSYGADVIDVGLVDTPFIYFAVNYLDCAGGVMVTASHNPPQYNGFKIAKRKAKPVGEVSGLADIRKHAAMIDRSVNQHGPTRVEQRDLWDAYVAHVRSFLDLAGRLEDQDRRRRVQRHGRHDGAQGLRRARRRDRRAHHRRAQLRELEGRVRARAQPARRPPMSASCATRCIEHKADCGHLLRRRRRPLRGGRREGRDRRLRPAHGVRWRAHAPGQEPRRAIVYDLRSTKALLEEINAAGGDARALARRARLHEAGPGRGTAAASAANCPGTSTSATTSTPTAARSRWRLVLVSRGRGGQDALRAHRPASPATPSPARSTSRSRTRTRHWPRSRRRSRRGRHRRARRRDHGLLRDRRAGGATSARATPSRCCG
jgi:hypothetical protein